MSKCCVRPTEAMRFRQSLKANGCSLGMKFGMYSSAGYYTCGRYAASLGKETIDANTFASWGVDYLKYDNCMNCSPFSNPDNQKKKLIG
jgi:hypothetical protein